MLNDQAIHDRLCLIQDKVTTDPQDVEATLREIIRELRDRGCKAFVPFRVDHMREDEEEALQRR